MAEKQATSQNVVAALRDLRLPYDIPTGGSYISTDGHVGFKLTRPKVAYHYYAKGAVSAPLRIPKEVLSMSTQLKETRAGYEVTTVAGLGTRRRIPRGPVKVAYGDKEALRTELVRQAQQARVDFGLDPQPKETVV